jgi:hypothetical protein
VAYAPAWIVFFANFYASTDKTSEVRGKEPPEWVQSLMITVFVMFSSFTLPLVLYQLRRPSPSTYWHTEVYYSVLSLVCKTTLNLTLVSRVIAGGSLDLSADDSLTDRFSGE